MFVSKSMIPDKKNINLIEDLLELQFLERKY